MDPFVGEIRPFSFGLVPKGWASCSGQLLPIAQNSALFSLLGTRFGGDGIRTFGLPDLRGRTPIGTQAANVNLGESSGVESVTLVSNQLPAHNHIAVATNTAANSPAPASGLLAQTDPSFPVYGSPNALVAIAPATIGQTGGNQPHPNMQPSLTINYCIALQGVYPPRS